MTVEAFPLAWPAGQPRTPSHKIQRSRFSVTPGRARDDLFAEIDRLGGRYPVISSDMPLRRDGQPYASHKPPEDKGVAVYFEKNGKQMCFACDQWDYMRDNIWAIKKTIEAIRGIERWGSSDMMNRAFSAFEELPAPDAVENWRDVLGCQDIDDMDTVKIRYQRLRKIQHPDHGGDAEQFNRIQTAYSAAQLELS